MLKFYDTAVTFSEFPDEVALCINITGCPCHCEGCSEPWLRQDTGTPLTEKAIKRLIETHPDCTVFGLMGGDSDHAEVARIADFVHANSDMRVGMYSGRDDIDEDLARHLDYYKVGRWIMPPKDPARWGDQPCGPLEYPGTNQQYYRCKVGSDHVALINETAKFQQHIINDFENRVIRYS